MASAAIPSQIDAYRQQRNAVRARHAAALSAAAPTSKPGESSRTKLDVRTHPRWKEVEAKQRIQTVEPIKADSPDASLSQPILLGPAFIPSESTVRNDYSQHFVDTQTGDLPSNAVRNPHKASRFAEYPKLARLIEAKNDLLNAISHPPTYLQADLLPSLSGPSPQQASAADSDSSEQAAGAPSQPFHLTDLLPIKYDVVIIDPPLEAYEWESVPHGQLSKHWSWNQVAALPIPQIVAKESFIFLWVGSGASDGLERGREVLMRWGYRRCEDIVWIRTSPSTADPTAVQPPTSSTFVRTIEHCLMGIRGTVRRSTDARFVHCNIDTDVILWPGEECDGAPESEGSSAAPMIDARSKPPEMMDLIENFCLGTRRLELFGRNRNLRRGWLTIGQDVGPDRPGWSLAEQVANPCAATTQNADAAAVQAKPELYSKARYDTYFGIDRPGCSLLERSNLVPYSEEIEGLRPKSPRPNQERAHVGGTAFDTRSRTNAAPVAHLPPSSVTIDPTAAYAPGMLGVYGHHHHYPAATSISSGGGAGLSGLGAGGRSVVSVPSGSEMLSGAQASVLLGQEQQQQGTANPASGAHHHNPSHGASASRSGRGQSGPNGLGRRGSRRRQA